MKNKKLWTPYSERQLRVYRQVLEEQAKRHQMAVEVARAQSGFTDDRALNAYAVSIGIKTSEVISSPGWLFLDRAAAKEGLSSPGLLFEWAQEQSIDETDAFVWLTCVAFNLLEGDVRAVLRQHEIDREQFRAVKDYMTFAELVALLWRINEDKGPDDAEAEIAALNAKAFGLSEEDKQ